MDRLQHMISQDATVRVTCFILSRLPAADFCTRRISKLETVHNLSAESPRFSSLLQPSPAEDDGLR